MTTSEKSVTHPTIVDIYCRSATDGPETRATLERQEAACRAYCQEHELTVGMVHHEVASGANYHNRERLNLIRTRYRDGQIHGVVIRTLDRLSRSTIHFIILMEEMGTQNVVLHCVDEDMENTPIGKFVRMVLGILIEVTFEKALDASLPGAQLKKGTHDWLP